MKLEQFLSVTIAVLLLILITAWIYLGLRLYQAVKKRKLEKRYVIVTDASDRSLAYARYDRKRARVTSSSSMPDLTDTDNSSTEDYSDDDLLEDNSKESTKVIIVDP